MTYRAPVSEILFSMTQLGGLSEELGDGVAQAILEEAGRVAETLLLPLDPVGDRHGAVLQNRRVTTAPGWAAAYAAWRQGGWNGVAAPAEHGGMGLGLLLNAACLEIWSSCNAAFALAPLLTMGAIEALRAHGSETLKALYLPKLVSGEWTGTMNLTESQAGSDVGALRTRAEPAEDGTYRITGQKIFITYGDHDMTDNIVHLVLARLPAAPAGSRGISLFLVPKILPGADGAPGRPNDLFCAGLEHKLGMHGSPTCTMVFGDGGGATGWLIGEENRGLACMFTMMNNARLAVGIEGVAAAERATQKAVAFARSRRQGRAAGQAGPGPSAIVAHPDVARMLLTMRAQTAAARAICHLAATSLDRAARANGTEAGRQAAERAALLIPVAKAYATDIGHEVASLGVQVHGGMGYIEETGAAQIMRDVRITSIYEGTNGIQALDLVQRKLNLGDGGVVAAEIADMRGVIDRLRQTGRAGLGASAPRLADTVEALEKATGFMRNSLADRPEQAQLGATAYLRLFGLARGGTALATLALAAEDGSKDATRRGVIARFFAEQLCPAASGLALAITDGASALEDANILWDDPD